MTTADEWAQRYTEAKTELCAVVAQRTEIARELAELKALRFVYCPKCGEKIAQDEGR